MDDDPLAGRAGLAVHHDPALDRLVGDQVDVGVVEYQAGVVATELEVEESQRLRGRPGDRDPGPGRPGKRDGIDPIGRGKSGADVGPAVDRLDHRLRHTGLDQGEPEPLDHQRSLDRRLDHDRVAPDQRRGALLDEKLDREVERQDRRDHTERLAAGVGEVPLGAGVALGRQDPTGQAAAFFGVAVKEVDSAADLELRLGQRLAGLRRQQRAELGALDLEQVGRPVEHGGPLGNRPGRPVPAGGDRRGDDRLDFTRVGGGDLAENL